MIRWSVGFGLLGFVAAIVVALGGDAPFERVIWAALLWGATFTLLGFFLARVFSILAAEGGIPEMRPILKASTTRTAPPVPAGVGSGEMANPTPEFSSGSSGAMPITDDEGSAPDPTPDRTPRTSSKGSIGGMGGDSNEDPNPED